MKKNKGMSVEEYRNNKIKALFLISLSKLKFPFRQSISTEITIPETKSSHGPPHHDWAFPSFAQCSVHYFHVIGSKTYNFESEYIK